VGKQVHLDWQDDPSATKYKFRVRRDSKKGPLVAKKNGLTVSEYDLSLVPRRDSLYYWRVKACNESKCSKWSQWWTFTFVPEQSWWRDDWFLPSSALAAGVSLQLSHLFCFTPFCSPIQAAL